MDEWGYVIAVVIGVLISEGIRWFRDWRQGEEKYRVMLYEKRLEAHQKADYHVEQLLVSFGYSLYRPNLTEDMESLYRKAGEFYDSNCLYLDERSRIEIVKALVLVGKICYGKPVDKDSREAQEAFNQLLKAQKAIEIGIGMKHIEEPKEEQTEDKS